MNVGLSIAALFYCAVEIIVISKQIRERRDEDLPVDSLNRKRKFLIQCVVAIIIGNLFYIIQGLLAAE